MADLPALFRRSIERCTALVEGIGADQWSRPTPCADWDLRALVNHLCAEQLWAPHLLAGETIEQVGDRYDGDVLGDDPQGTWRSAAASVEAFARPGVVDRTVQLSYGDESAREYLTQMLTDAAVHGWDIARAIGAADHEIDPEAASLLLDHWRAREQMLRGSGLFGDAVAVPGGAGDAAQLLGLLGRRP